MHHDDDLYPDATDYDAFRFSRELERRDEGSTDEVSKKEPLPAVHTSKSYLGFGHGQHSWYAANRCRNFFLNHAVGS